MKKSKKLRKKILRVVSKEQYKKKHCQLHMLAEFATIAAFVLLLLEHLSKF